MFVLFTDRAYKEKCFYYLGKWHLGHCDTRYTPQNRGFDTFLGSYSGILLK